jgi:hypothetical protein
VRLRYALKDTLIMLVPMIMVLWRCASGPMCALLPRLIAPELLIACALGRFVKVDCTGRVTVRYLRPPHWPRSLDAPKRRRVSQQTISERRGERASRSRTTCRS